MHGWSGPDEGVITRIWLGEGVMNAEDPAVRRRFHGRTSRVAAAKSFIEEAFFGGKLAAACSLEGGYKTVATDSTTMDMASTFYWEW